jgi:hypothetical protein
MRHSKTCGPFLLLVLAACAAGGCASRGEKMVQGFSKTRSTVSGAQAQVDQSLAALQALRATPAEGLSGSYRRYKESVAGLEKEGEKAKVQAMSMKEEAEAHMSQWEQEMKTFKDPQVKASMEARREAVRSNFVLVRMYAQDARAAYGPYLGGSREIVRALSIDLSPAAVTSLAPAMDKVAADGMTLKQKLAAMQHALENISNGVSPIGDMK